MNPMCHLLISRQSVAQASSHPEIESETLALAMTNWLHQLNSRVDERLLLGCITLFTRCITCESVHHRAIEASDNKVLVASVCKSRPVHKLQNSNLGN
ncbi:hypothetical protein KIN20_028939 [Parelaphostrongylus tenuis]|uniref:Uncharacterized protein n=1 Tax=Parelaphostrongylus tenuis TaxID=148309 RepID=A0AAD5WF70_PARTN|nr:hypothetical protein KIN20_028939 [Parelaphostrongylus tenuis]